MSRKPGKVLFSAADGGKGEEGREWKGREGAGIVVLGAVDAPVCVSACGMFLILGRMA